MVGFEFNENPLIADRIQLSISIPFFLFEDKYSYIQSVFKAYLSDKKAYKVVYDKRKHQYYIEVDPDCYIEHKENWYLFEAEIGIDEESIDKNLIPLIGKTDMPK